MGEPADSPTEGSDAENVPDVAFTLGENRAVDPVLSLADADSSDSWEIRVTNTPSAEEQAVGTEGSAGSGDDVGLDVVAVGGRVHAESEDALTPDHFDDPDDFDALDDFDELDDALALVAATIADAMPPGWSSARATFAMTVGYEVGEIVYTYEDRTVRSEPSETVLELVRDHRETLAREGDEPWWRLVLEIDAGGGLDVEYDLGDEPFPSGELFAPEAYRADLQEYPRDRVPVWLAAYIGHRERQWRSPADAARGARADLEGHIWPTRVDNEFPVFPAMWARWATISAAFVSIGSDRGPRIGLPGLGIFESSQHSGSTLQMLSDGRAVLSGGVWNAPTLDAVYNDGVPMPAYYAGAPAWVADPVLNPRAAAGLMSFCYWWDAGAWYRGESPTAEHCASALPGVWTLDTVVDVVLTVVVGDDAVEDFDERRAVAALVAAAEAGEVTRDLVLTAFGDGPQIDIDSALYQFSLAGLVSTLPPQIPSAAAISRVRDYIIGRDLDTDGYPLSELVAERFAVGWMIYVPVPEDEIAIGRAIFYVTDDGVLEHSSSSIPPAEYMSECEQRFRERHGSADLVPVYVGG
ncbi:hypothetical protein [Nocardia sp. CDC160]|uniref:hypothetical protein n=1 Tax=Nocardia sp. CDC160 TaxID=3112166 RepID=UPI002DBFA63D|nr:hypothetical protein [Nocardia sp. CDC160]MEC3919244.1 hypothetical protein [Nocardia sp. CDC160]